MKKSAATPMILLVGLGILLINLVIHLGILFLPSLKCLYRGANVYIHALLVVVEDKSRSYAYYCLPDATNGLVKTFSGVLIVDISLTIASFCTTLRSVTGQAHCRLGSRICE